MTLPSQLRPVLIRVVVGLLTLALPAGTPWLTGPARAGSAEVAVAWYPIDGPDGLRDYSRTDDPLRVRAAGDGVVSLGPALGRYAARFPTVCVDPIDPADCPRAVLEAAPNPAHNPGTRPVRFGVVVALMPGTTNAGQNIMQKGFATGGSEWKVQIDGTAGFPSCVLAGGWPNRIYRVIAPVDVADGGWHAIECRRDDGGTLSILLDGITQGTVDVPPDLSIANDQPLLIGGRRGGVNNDQFHGYLDAAWLFIG